MDTERETKAQHAVPATATKTLGILQTGRSPTALLKSHADYNQFFIDMLGADSFLYRTWAVLDNEFPSSIDEADAWLITGSKFGTYEPHAWIPPLEELIRQIHANGAPLVGICFGHQIIAQALGGKVEKFDGGWSVGRVDYTLDPAVWNTQSTTETPLMAFHQDQVIEPPAEAVTVGHSNVCRHAALAYGSNILTIQPHPEFDSRFVGDLLQARSDLLPTDVLEKATRTLQEPLARDAIARKFKEFLNQTPADNS
jgi:GMP synthase (glutamine-hydrolysing)